MADFLAGVNWPGLTLNSALLGTVVWVIHAILTDRLVTRQRLEDERAEKAEWREVALKQQETNAQVIDQVGKLQAGVDACRRVIEALPRPKGDDQ